MKKYTAVVLTVIFVVSLLAGCGGKNTGSETENLDVAQTTEDPGMTWQEQYDLGIRLLSEGKYEEAILAFSAAIAIAPKSAQNYISRADAYTAWADSVATQYSVSEETGERLVLSNITVSTSQGDKTLEELYEEAIRDYETAIDLMERGEAAEEDLAGNAAEEAAKKAAELLIKLAESLLSQKEEEGVLDRILAYLDQAAELTDDEEIQKHIDAIYSAATTPAEARLPLGYRVVYENTEDGSADGWTKFVYDENGVRIGTIYVRDDGTESDMSYIYYDANGHELPGSFGGEALETNENGLVTATGASRVSERFAYDENGNVAQYSYMFDSDGNPGYIVNFFYDSENRLIQNDSYNMGGSNHDSSQFYTYNADGLLTQKAYTWYYSTGSGTNYINYQYDSAGRLVYQETLDGNGEAYIWTSYTYNGAGELVSEYHYYEPNPEWGGPYTYEYIYE